MDAGAADVNMLALRSIYDDNIYTLRNMVREAKERQIALEDLDVSFMFFLAARRDFVGIVEVLVEDGLMEKSKEEQRLLDACNENSVKIVTYLLDQRTEPCEQILQEKLLEAAATSYTLPDRKVGPSETLRMLLGRGFEPTQDILAAAEERGHEDCIEALLEWENEAGRDTGLREENEQ